MTGAAKTEMDGKERAKMKTTKMKTYLPLFVVTAVLGTGLLYACAGAGVLWSEIEQPVKDSCISCHDSSKIDQFITDIKAYDDSFFTAANFPDSNFPSGLIKKDVAALIKAADPPEDGKLDPKTPLRKAWILHEAHELQALLKEKTPPDYTTEAKFNAFTQLKEQDNYEGCEIGTKLDDGFKKDAEGMPPQWTQKLLDALKMTHKDLNDQQRQDIKDYVDGLIPGGLKACVPTTGSAS